MFTDFPFTQLFVFVLLLTRYKYEICIDKEQKYYKLMTREWQTKKKTFFSTFSSVNLILFFSSFNSQNYFVSVNIMT